MDPITQPPKQWLPNIDPVGWISPKDGLKFFTDDFIPFLIDSALFLTFFLSLLFLLIGGTMWIMSRGDKEGLQKARSTITYALIGLALGLGSFIILNVLDLFFNVNLLR